MSDKKREVKFIFDNDRAAEHFLIWLCEVGEQDYWQYMEYREEEEEGDITVTFDYWGGTADNDDAVEFGSKDIICKSIRRDKNEEDDQEDESELDEG